MTDFQNRPGPITPDSAPDPARRIISLLFKGLAGLVVVAVLLVVAALFILLPRSYMENTRMPTHLKWKPLSEKLITEKAAIIFKDTDQAAAELGFQPVTTYSATGPAYYKPEAKIFLSSDSRIALIQECFWITKEINCQRSLNTYFQDGRQVTTGNVDNHFNLPEPDWRSLHSDPGYKDLDAQYQDHLKAVEKITAAGGVPTVLTQENLESTVTAFQDKINQWRSEHGILETVPGQDEYQLTYRMALKRILAGLKLKSAKK
jgi:hypothetical protein